MTEYSTVLIKKVRIIFKIFTCNFFENRVSTDIEIIVNKKVNVKMAVKTKKLYFIRSHNSSPLLFVVVVVVVVDDVDVTYGLCVVVAYGEVLKAMDVGDGI